MFFAKKFLCKEDILNKVSDYDIFRMYLGNFKLGGAMCSPFGKDSNPSFLVKVGKSGKIIYRDMRFPNEYTGDCFKLVMQLFGLSFEEAINKIACDFGMCDGTNKYQVIKETYIEPIKEPKPEKIFKMIEREFTLKDLEYWNQFTISREDCKKEHIYSIKSAWIDDMKLEIEKDELAFAYYFPLHDKWKYYFPERKGKGKWWTNLSNLEVEGKDNLINCDRGVISKSRKDRIILSKLGINTCNAQNESESAFTEDFVSFLRNNCNTVYISFDTDPTGCANSLAITSKFGFKHINVPKHYAKQGAKDWGDMVKLDGIDPVIKHFKKKGFKI